MRIKFDDAAIFDSKNKKWKSINSLVIRDTKFEYIEYSNTKKINNLFIIPGLIDSHIHIGEESDFTQIKYFSLNEDFKRTISRVERNCNIALSKGITSIVDFGFYKDSSIAIRDYIKSNPNKVQFPHFITSGAMLTKKNGHATERGLIVSNNNLVETIKSLIDYKVDVIKILNDPIVFSKDEVSVITKLAHSKNIKVSMHLYTDDAANLAIESKIDCIQHAGYFTDSTIESIIKAGIIVVPTFIASLDTIINPSLTLPKDYFPDITIDTFKKWFNEECDIINKLHTSGVKLACGTDACFLGTPADSLIREMIAWDYFDIPIKNIIQSATYYAALSVSKEHKLGQIKEGFSADFVVYTTNPENNINILKTPFEIWLKGKKIKSGDYIRRILKNDLQNQIN